MTRSYIIGNHEKHRIDFHILWWLGMVTFSCDGRGLFRRPFFFKFEKTFEIGRDEKHLVNLRFNLFDYYHEVLTILIDGQPPLLAMEVRTKEIKRETPLDDAAGAFLFVAVVNVIFSVIGTLFVPYLDQLQVRMMLLLGAMIYFLFAVKTLQGSRVALTAGILFFLGDSAYGLFQEFSLGGILVRVCVLSYLGVGAYYLWSQPRIGQPVKELSAGSGS